MEIRVDLQAIKARWDSTSQIFKGLSFELAKADMDALMAEVERLQGIEREKEYAEAQLKQGLLRYKQMQQQMVFEMEAVVRKYDTF